MSLISSGTIPAGEFPRMPVPAARIRQDLARVDDHVLLTIVVSLPRTSQRRAAACELLVGRYSSLVRSCVQVYRHSPEPVEDLMQVGYVGLIKAINSFDLSAGNGLGTYARPYVSGEIKRYFRDKRWQIHVTRTAKELAMQAHAATGQLTQELGRTPAGPDLARYLGVSSHDLRDAQLAEMAFHPFSLDAPLSGQSGEHSPASLTDVLGQEDPRMEHMLGMQAIATHWGELPSREQKILLMNFYDGMTQAQIGHRLGISQMHVSRLLGHALGYLRRQLLGLDEAADLKRGPPPSRAPRAAKPATGMAR